jgi:hypothetical protein
MEPNTCEEGKETQDYWCFRVLQTSDIVPNTTFRMAECCTTVTTLHNQWQRNFGLRKIEGTLLNS